MPSLKGDPNAMRILFSSTLACLMLGMFVATASDLIFTVDAQNFKGLIATGHDAMDKTVGWTTAEASKAWNEVLPNETAKAFMVLLATEVTFFLTDHHTTQDRKWAANYSAKLAKMIIGDDPPDSDLIQTTVRTVGHLTSMHGAMKWLCAD